MRRPRSKPPFRPSASSRAALPTRTKIGRDASIPVKAKARLRVGGHGILTSGSESCPWNQQHKDKSYVVRDEHGWKGSIGDVAAFLNGVKAPRSLYFRQPAFRGLPGEEPGFLVEILKGVFSLTTSRRLRFQKLVGDLKELKLAVTEGNITMEQNMIDPCTFQVILNEVQVVGILQFHVHDLRSGLTTNTTRSSSQRCRTPSPSASGILRSSPTSAATTRASQTATSSRQSSYIHERLKAVEVPKGANDEVAGAEAMQDNCTAIGCLSWWRKSHPRWVICVILTGQSARPRSMRTRA